MNYDKFLWGKKEPFYPLSRHMLDVGACASVYMDAPSSRWLRRKLAEWLGVSEREAVNIVSYIASMHDIGKTHPQFQIRCDADRNAWREAGYHDIADTRINLIRHEAYSEVVARRLWNDNADAFKDDIWRMFCAVLRLHHQGKSVSERRISGCAQVNEIQDDLDFRMRRAFTPVLSNVSTTNVDALGIILTGLVILSDWVASSEVFGMNSSDMTDDEHVIWAKERAQITLRAFGLICDKSQSFPSPRRFTEFWPGIPKNGLRPLQAACERLSDVKALLTIIEGPMGEGKTEAGLFVAGRLCELFEKRGVYVGLPTGATSNQMYYRVAEMMKSHDIIGLRLLHSAAWLLDDVHGGVVRTEDAAQASDWLKPLRRGLLSENAVGTVDQAMAAVLRLKYGVLRLEGLASKVLVIDEIHAYDVYMSQIIERLLDWCRALSIPVVLMSATLQNRQKQKYIKCYTDQEYKPINAYPLITQVVNGEIRQTEVKGAYMNTRFEFKAVPTKLNARVIARLALEKAVAGARLCVMMNTVKKTRQVYMALKELNAENVIVFHARYRARRRSEIEKECLEVFGKGGHNTSGMILVCSQVVEQSLDIDFDCMITELAPIDLLLQRAGRVHRHKWRARPDGMNEPVIWVLIPDAQAPQNIDKRYCVSGSIYAPCVLYATEKLLGAGRYIRVPEDVRDSVESVYNDFDDAAVEAYINKQLNDQLNAAQAQGNILPKPSNDHFIGEYVSNGVLFDMDDTDGLDAAMGARTRNGADSVRIAFLPPDFGSVSDFQECRKRIYNESCSIRLTKATQYDIIRHEQEKSKYIDNYSKKPEHAQNDCIVLRPEPDGTYRLGNLVFHADDEFGIREAEEDNDFCAERPIIQS